MFSEVNVFKFSKLIHQDMQSVPFLTHICWSAYASTRIDSCKVYAKFFV